MSNEQQPIPVFERIICPTCGRKGVAEVGNKVICESCVNEFLAKNVGLMQPMVEEPAASAGEFMPKQD